MSRKNIPARLAEAEAIIADMRKAERHPSLADGEREFRRQTVAFFAFAHSIVAMAKVGKPLIGSTTAKWDADHAKFFDWFRVKRNASLKEGELPLRVELTAISELAPDEQLKFDKLPPDQPTGRHAILPTGRSSTSRMVNVYKLEIDGARLPAIDTCERYLALVRRFLGDLKIL